MAYSPIRFTNTNVATANTTTTLYTVPTGQNLIVTQLTLTASGEVGGTSIYLGDNQGAGGYGGQIASNAPLANFQQRTWQGFYVVNGDGAINTLVASGNTTAWFHGVGLVGTGLVEGGTPWRASQNLTAVGDTTLYTVPAGRTLVVKTIVMTNAHGTVANTASVRAGGTPIVPYLAPIGVGATRQYDGTWLFPANEAILINVGTASTPGVSFYLSGVLY